MSRTYRRKKSASWDFNPYDYDYSNGFLQKIWIERDSAEYKKLKAKYHSDSYFTYQVPHCYINRLERIFRRLINREIYQWMKNPENYEVINHKHMCDARYLYW